MAPFNLEELIAVEDRFQSQLKDGRYTVIAPLEQRDLDKFLALVNKHFFTRSMHDLLSDRMRMHALIRTLPSNIRMVIYVMDREGEELLFRTDIREYVRQNQIDFDAQ